MSGKPQPDRPKQATLNLCINFKKLLAFNLDISDSDRWASYYEPFNATQFVTINANGDLQWLDNIVEVKPNTALNINIQPLNGIEGLDDPMFEVIHVRLDLIGPKYLDRTTPRKLWGEVLNLDKTDGAIGESCHFYLGQVDGPDDYCIVTANSLNNHSPNIVYQICFSLTLNGFVKYFIIDPLIRTSSED